MPDVLPTATAGAAAASSTASTSVLARAARAVRALRARRDFVSFAEFVLKDESTGAPLQLCAMHREWARLLETHDKIQLLAHVESGKSNLVSVGWVLFQLGRNPNTRAVVISNTSGQAEKLLRSIARQIERNEALREVFPHLRPSQPWNVNALTIERGTVSKDASVAAVGLHGALIGSRVDLLVIDDALDFESSRTESGRATAIDWIRSTALSRTTVHAQTICVGTPWHKEDLHSKLEEQWPTFRFPVERDDGTPSWPARWSPERIARKRLELGPSQSARQLDCVCRADETASVDEAWIATALRRGATEALRLQHNTRGEPYLLNRPVYPARIVCGLDPSVGRTGKSDLSALVTIFVRPDGSREVLEVQSGRWSGPQILQRVDSVHERFAPSRIIVESNGSQEFLMHFAKQRGERLPLERFVTGRGQKSMEWLCERLGAEMASGKWIIPSVDGVPATAELRALVRDLMAYSPRDHTPDRLAALLLATTAAAQPAARVEWFRIPNLHER